MSKRWMAAALMAGGLSAVGLAMPANATATTAVAATATCNGLPVTILGTSASETINGTEGNDVISALGGNDVVNGLGGNDTACLGTGNDRFDGGAGADTFVAEATPDGSDVTVGDFQDTVTYAARTTPIVVRMDNSNNDGAPGEFDNIGDVGLIRGGSGDDQLTILAPQRGQTTIFGGPGNDTIKSVFDSFGEAGNDYLENFAGAGSSFLHGGDGNDSLINHGAASSLQGDNGADKLIGGTQSAGDTYFGGAGDDQITGGSGNDFASGDAGNDQIAGGLGNDSVIGGDGDDTYIATITQDGQDMFTGGPGVDTANYSARNNLATGGVLSLSLDEVFGNDGEPGERDSLFSTENVKGGTGHNVIQGNTGANSLTGGQSSDEVFGADGIAGNDVIVGGPGTDSCTFDVGDRVTC